jgi:hypothetical protein
MDDYRRGMAVDLDRNDAPQGTHLSLDHLGQFSVAAQRLDLETGPSRYVVNTGNHLATSERVEK